MNFSAHLRTLGATMLLGACLIGAGCSNTQPAPTTPAASPATAPSGTGSPAATRAGTSSVPGEAAPAGAKEVTTASGLKYTELKVGTGATAAAGQTVSVHYTGWLANGTKFDSSVDRGQPFDFGLGQHMVIPGWDEGVAGMKVGGKRKLTIPSELGYGARGAGDKIPPNATLVFDVELLSIK